MSVSDLIFERMSAASGGVSEGALSLAHERPTPSRLPHYDPKVPAWRSALDEYNRRRQVYLRSTELAETARKANLAVIAQKDRIGDLVVAANSAYDRAFAAQDRAVEVFNAAIHAFENKTGSEAAIATVLPTRQQNGQPGPTSSTPKHLRTSCLRPNA